MTRICVTFMWLTTLLAPGCSEYDFHGKQGPESGSDDAPASPQIIAEMT